MEKKTAVTEDDRDPYSHPRVPYRGHYDRRRCDLRRGWVERFASCSLEQVGGWWDGEGEDDSRSCSALKGNIENPIGLAKIPLAAAGPLLVRGRHVNGYVLVPCATTEGALVASITRGAAALTRAGGVFTLPSEKYMNRAPCFVCRNAAESEQVWQWLVKHKENLQEQVRQYSQHTVLESMIPFRQGRTLVARFNFTTGDASGQNMVTTATWHVCKWALEQIKKDLPDVCVTDFIVESLVSGDKQSAASMLVLPRGVHVQAEAWIPESVLQSTLKVDLQAFLATYNLMQEGQVQLGALGSTINVGNLLAAVFIATGQDPASITECAHGLLIVRPATKQEIETQGMTRGDPRVGVGEGVTYSGVYASLTLPGLVIGTVGGGTQLATQKECLSMMGCYGKDGVFRLAEIIAGFALGLDLSLISAIASGQFATAHEKLGRNRPTSGLREEHLVPQLFQDIVGERGTVENWTSFSVNTGNSILSELTKRELSKRVGHFGFKVTYRTREGKSRQIPVVLKSKPTDIEVCNMVNKMAQACGLSLAIQYEKFKMNTDFRFCSRREVELCRLDNPVLRQFMPTVYHTLMDESKVS
jgi:hydroxymethylglutaryl-CoA reductase (NADPH)